MWMNLLVNPATGTSAENQRRLCDAIEKRYPLVLTRSLDFDPIGPSCIKNTKVFLDYLDILEKEEE